MSIEKMLAMLTEGSTFRSERMDGNLIELPVQDIAGALGSVSRQIRMRRSRRSAGLSTEFGLELLVARGTDHEAIKHRVAMSAAARLWRLFWNTPQNESARVSKAQVQRVARVAVDDFCNPGHFHGISDYAISRAMGIDQKTWERKFKVVYGRLKTEMSRAEYPVRLDFWTALG